MILSQVLASAYVGSQGAQGTQGAQGIQGIQGTQGTQGLQGGGGTTLTNDEWINSTPDAKGRFYFANNGHSYFAAAQNIYLTTNGTGNDQFSFDVNGNFVASGNVQSLSDIRLKGNIQTIPNALHKLGFIDGITYDRKDQQNGVRYAGVIAQQVECVLPEVVLTDENGVKSVAYGNLVALLIEALKEQQRIVADHTSRIIKIESKEAILLASLNNQG